jgi:hypothetical protein
MNTISALVYQDKGKAEAFIRKLLIPTSTSSPRTTNLW